MVLLIWLGFQVLLNFWLFSWLVLNVQRSILHLTPRFSPKILETIFYYWKIWRPFKKNRRTRRSWSDRKLNFLECEKNGKIRFNVRFELPPLQFFFGKRESPSETMDPLQGILSSMDSLSNKGNCFERCNKVYATTIHSRSTAWSYSLSVLVMNLKGRR